MKAFLSHSSADKDFVLQIYNALEPDSLWLDRAEIEWGSTFIERIEEGIKNASDFVLFWSKNSAKSRWVNVELNMAFMELIVRRAIRLRVIRMDGTELPLRLEPYHHLSVADSQNPIDEVIDDLREVLAQPTQGARNRFLNRHSELGRIENMILDSETRVIPIRHDRAIIHRCVPEPHPSFPRKRQSTAIGERDCGVIKAKWYNNIARFPGHRSSGVLEKGGLGEALAGAGVTTETVLGFADEMRVGLRGMVRRVWGRRGVKVRQRVQLVYEWRYLFCVVDGRSGKLLWNWIDSMRSERIAEAVNGLRHGTDVGALVWDGAARCLWQKRLSADSLRELQLSKWM